MFTSKYFASRFFAHRYFASGAGPAVPIGVGVGLVAVRYGHFRLRRASLTRRDAIAVAMQNRQEQ